MELTILMPCLNEIETLATCINKAKQFLARTGISGEILIADNGSQDGSIETALDCGARVVRVPVRGYGAALMHGTLAAQGRYVIMGDSDDSYDFSRLELFVAKLREGYDLVMGNRFQGGIADGAMPFLHRYLGNPVLSFLGRLFFSIPIGDFHCGLRGFNRDKLVRLGLQTTGMEFASEMVVRSALSGYKICEVPTTLAKDGRSRPPHLRTWRDGWRHLRFLLMFSPRWLFFYPGLLFFFGGLLLTFVALPGPFQLAPGIALDVHTVVLGCMSTLIGAQCISFAHIARRYAAFRGFLPAAYPFQNVSALFTLERAVLVAGILVVLGLLGVASCMVAWARVGLGPLPYGQLVRVLVTSGTCVSIGLQLAFTGFLSEVLEIKSGSESDVEHQLVPAASSASA
ncbi:glycosyltransferase family 2 protein [Pararobbsia silviterrae]|uniref:Glycosyltransferase family 2 protein n=1 Tax=Pararobbsia silviterrae TaxID=1792498 RepID=A0A494YF93_9BURK|nr:glycosyltransferase family 2 protein [Pararobbsia silviterrae]RKP59043.1 glycosyltransferase family 2 protein [Pararobbsia silviterrae]